MNCINNAGQTCDEPELYGQTVDIYAVNNPGAAQPEYYWVATTVTMTVAQVVVDEIGDDHLVTPKGYFNK